MFSSFLQLLLLRGVLIPLHISSIRWLIFADHLLISLCFFYLLYFSSGQEWEKAANCTFMAEHMIKHCLRILSRARFIHSPIQSTLNYMSVFPLCSETFGLFHEIKKASGGNYNSVNCWDKIQYF